MIFKSQNIGNDNDEMQAILTPSTKGIRQALTDSDISFTMPLMQTTTTNTNENNVSMESEKSQLASDEKNTSLNEENDVKTNPKNKLNADQDDEDENENEIDGFDEPDEWLEQMGLNSAVNFKASILQRNSKNQKKDSLLNFDNRPRSTLLFLKGK